MKQVLIKSALRKAVEQLVAEDADLLEVSASERSICHRLAVHLSKQPEFQGWNVDCEFNRDGRVPKALGVGKGRRRVFPDIIVHRRGANGPNLLVLEMKIGSSRTARDEEKVRLYIQEFGYKVGLSIVVPKSAHRTFKLKWYAANTVNPVTEEWPARE